ncbi:MAG: hypothetical protein IAE83_11660 [Anaerolinea sp.]|nr:hypothetical protein [Anaerolinea sp.]
MRLSRLIFTLYLTIVVFAAVTFTVAAAPHPNANPLNPLQQTPALEQPTNTATPERQWCRHSADCGGRGLVCQCEWSLPKSKGGFAMGTSGGWTLTCPVTWWKCLDRNYIGYTYFTPGYAPPLDTVWRPPSEYAVFDSYYGSWDGIHPDLVNPLNRFFSDPEVKQYLDQNRLVIIITSGYRVDDHWSQHISGRAIDIYLTPRDHTGTGGRRMFPINPLRPYLLKVGFIYPTAWDAPHYYLPEANANQNPSTLDPLREFILRATPTPESNEGALAPTLMPTAAATSQFNFPPTNTPKAAN